MWLLWQSRRRRQSRRQSGLCAVSTNTNRNVLVESGKLSRADRSRGSGWHRTAGCAAGLSSCRPRREQPPKGPALGAAGPKGMRAPPTSTLAGPHISQRSRDTRHSMLPDERVASNLIRRQMTIFLRESVPCYPPLRGRLQTVSGSCYWSLQARRARLGPEGAGSQAGPAARPADRRRLAIARRGRTLGDRLSASPGRPLFRPCTVRQHGLDGSCRTIWLLLMTC